TWYGKVWTRYGKGMRPSPDSNEIKYAGMPYRGEGAVILARIGHRSSKPGHAAKPEIPACCKTWDSGHVVKLAPRHPDDAHLQKPLALVPGRLRTHSGKLRAVFGSRRRRSRLPPICAAPHQYIAADSSRSRVDGSELAIP